MTNEERQNLMRMHMELVSDMFDGAGVTLIVVLPDESKDKKASIAYSSNMRRQGVLKIFDMFREQWMAPAPKGTVIQ